MYERILIATDGSELATKAIVHGINLAKQLNAASLPLRKHGRRLTSRARHGGETRIPSLSMRKWPQQRRPTFWRVPRKWRRRLA